MDAGAGDVLGTGGGVLLGVGKVVIVLLAASMGAMAVEAVRALL